MRARSVWVVSGSILIGLVLGLAIRRARMPSTVPEVAGLPSRASVGAALLRAEIRDLDTRLGAVREESDRIEQEKLRLAALARPPASLPLEEELRRDLRAAMESRGFVMRKAVREWIRQDPANVGALLRLAAAVVREKRRSRDEVARCGEFLLNGYLAADQFADSQAQRDRIAAWLIESQPSEADVLVRGWMLQALDEWGVELPADIRAGLAKAFRETADPDLRDALLGHLMKDPESRELVAVAIRKNPDAKERSYQLLKAWDRRALPAKELRAQVRDIMASDRPEGLIQEAQNWVPKYINPLAPQETVGLFDGTLSKPIQPIHKAVSLMVLGSIASLFPGRPGRAEVGRFAESTDDPRLQEFARKVASLIDEGRSFAEIRKLNPLEYGLEPPK